MRRLWNLITWLSLSLLLILADQYTKLMAAIHLKGKEALVLLPNVFELLYSENRGAAFGILQGQQTAFFVIALLVIAAAGYLMYRMPGWKEKRYLPLRICVIMVTAGAVGNMIDRISLGYVVDFFYFCLIDFPIFNVADIYVTTAAAALVLLFSFYYQDSDLAVFSFKHSARKGVGKK